MVCIGVDLGQPRDFTAIAVVTKNDRITRVQGHLAWMRCEDRQKGAAELRFLERLRLGTPYTNVVERIVQIARHPVFANARRKLVVDASGVGRPVIDMIREARPGCDLWPVTITGGTGERYSGGMHCVAKTNLIAGLRASMEVGGVKIAGSLKEARGLVKELTDFGGRGHDDMAMALALAVWGVEARTVGERDDVRII